MERYKVFAGALEPHSAGHYVLYDNAQAEIEAADAARRHAQAEGTKLVERVREAERGLAVWQEKVRWLTGAEREARYQLTAVQEKNAQLFDDWKACRDALKGQIDDPDPLPGCDERDLTLYGMVSGMLRSRTKVRADLERVTQERDEARAELNDPIYQECCEWRQKVESELGRLRALILALPKVEGEIIEQGDGAFVRSAHMDGPLPEIPRAEQIALLRARQGMEG